MRKNFVMLFSGGKDSMMALHKCIKDGHTPLALIMMVKDNGQESWFHNIDKSIIKDIEKQLSIPIVLCNTEPKTYGDNMKKVLTEFKNKGADTAVFGDIDIYEHFEWCKNICDSISIDYYFPLWQQKREYIVNEFIKAGYKAIIKCVKNDICDSEILGKTLDYKMMDYFKEKNIDICGENGEYHTIVVDGPLFKNEVKVKLLDINKLEYNTVINMVSK